MAQVALEEVVGLAESALTPSGFQRALEPESAIEPVRLPQKSSRALAMLEYQLAMVEPQPAMREYQRQ